MSLEIIAGNLKEGYAKLEKGTFQCVDELMNARLDDLALRVLSFYTADGNGYFLRSDGGVDWVITREENNLVLSHLDDEVNSSYDQLVKNRNYLPDNDEAENARNSEDSVVVDMNKLRLSGEEKEFRYLKIRTSDGFIFDGNSYERPNSEERKAMKRLGYSLLNLKIMKSSEQNIENTRIFVLNPGYVKETLEGSGSGSLWWASWLSDFSINSSFYALDREISYDGRLRGVPIINSPKANEKNPAIIADDYTAAYKTLIGSPDKMTDDIAAGLNKAVADYLQNRNK